ncbi:MAG TPA: protein translocase subunit SecDF, partial [Chitinophagaceae bacterium]|nr:protein translocase subunit SecDF [Chitinophagaceae bacterium]
MRVLVSIFAAVLILISLYQLSFTWFVNKHESKIEDKASLWLNQRFTPADKKYPGDKEKQVLYQDTLNSLHSRYRDSLLANTRDEKITWWGQTYQKAKESELLLGLDLQGGINVTLDIALDGLIKGLANNPRDPKLLKAIDEATRRKVKSDADFITLFNQAWQDQNPNTPLAPLFANNTRNKLKIDASNNQVTSYIREQAVAAMKQTFQVITKRIDKFGVAQPNVSLDETKGIISVELAGAKDPERVRRYLQSTANLQFWEVYTFGDLQNSVTAADQTLATYLKSIKGTDTTRPTAAPAINISSVASDSATIADSATKSADTSRVDTTARATAEDHPLFQLIGFAQAYQNEDGKSTYPGYIGMAQIKDTSKINSYLNNPIVRNNFPGDVKLLWGKQERDDDGKLLNFLNLYAIKTVPGQDKSRLEGEMINDAYQEFEPVTNKVVVNMSMNKQGARVWANMTQKAFDQGKRPIAIVLDDIVYSAPSVNQPITGGNSTITMGSGKNTQLLVEEAQDLANILKSGKLEAPAKIVQEQIVGPTLGQEAVEGGMNAFLISFVVIFVLMFVYYNSSGWIANISLILNLLFTVGILSMFGFTLTAPGIAGLILTIGMAVDTNVIIFERIKEEIQAGKSYAVAFKEGYRRSLAASLDSHITILLTAIILVYFGLGPVLGFATTQIIGILLSLFCGIVISWLLTNFCLNRNIKLNYFTKFSRSIFQKANYKFIENRKYTYIVSIFVLLLGVGAFFNGFNQGVDFTGGRSYVVKFGRPVKTEDVRTKLEGVFGKQPIVKTYGASDQLDITTDYMIKESSSQADTVVRGKLFEGLQSYLPPGTTFQKFNTELILQTKSVDPTISDDLKTGAKWATFFSLLITSLYIFVRFRDWRYSAGTIIALLHDVLITIAVFSFFKDIVPFSLEIDQNFIAAILTVIGFSMNDKVIVFDRVREYTNTLHNVDRATIINRAVNDTLSRTLVTSLTVFITILILFLLGGSVVKGFAFAMLIGVITGIYSSIFVAAPILMDFAKNKPLGKADAGTAATATRDVKTKSPVMAKP